MRETILSSLRPLLSSKSSIFLIVVTPPILYVSTTFTRLLYQYPSTKIHPSHPIYTSRDNTRFSQEYVHWFSARIPLRYLLPATFRKDSPEKKKDIRTPVEVWTHAFFSTPTIALEEAVVGWAKGKGFKTGDQGERGIYVGQGFGHGVFKVIAFEREEEMSVPEASAVKEEEGREGRVIGRVIVEWDLSDSLVHIWEVAATKGLPWRHLTGGRHSLEVISYRPGDAQKKLGVTEGDGKQEEEYVTVRFGCALDIEKVNRLDGTGLPDGKLMPGWYIWLHEMYARWLVDGAVKKLARNR
ncbi:hypothetical protein H072_9784 [Dactylellina haptotyla CBS 200.50]|uniref:Uncharacterized protein n=1 Tax=Dactylellina haptotyla (strain CBS 200.50) TaxID=1284197 RepID=S8A0X5_DACHA|nr:hypothetical protein H072_9784 [Dactylellina haptotyla CBS 200.50]